MNEDLSSILEKLNINKDSISPEMIDNIMHLLNTSNTEDTSQAKSTNDVDINTILKMKSIIDKINSKGNDSRSKLLESLRPYLNEDKQTKLDQYIQISKLIDILPLISGEINGSK